MQRWQYHIHVVPSPAPLRVLNDLGADGWELVAVLAPGDGTREFHFKRPVAGPAGETASLRPAPPSMPALRPPSPAVRPPR